MKLNALICLPGMGEKAYRQTLLAMKLLSFFIIAAIIETNARGYAQTINISLHNVTLETAFKEIKKQTGYRFIYTKEEINLAKPVSINIKNADLVQVLDICFYQQPLQYLIEDRYIVVTPRKEPVKEIVSGGIIDISGKATNEKDEPLAGVTVKVKGSNKFTATDNEGLFILKGIDENDVLQFSGTNVEEYEIKIDARKELSVRLKTKFSKLDEVQVIGYGNTTKRLNTGNVSKVSSEEIGQQPVANPLAALQGRTAGVLVSTLNGLPGGNISVQIRGRGSINSGTEPLYVIDGVPFISTPLNGLFSSLGTGINGVTSPLNSISPGDIESVEILKDADATAIYGSRGANGVILITTKKGKAGKTRFDVSIYSGLSKLASFPKMLNLQEYLEIRREGFVNDNRNPTVTNAPELLVWDTTKGRDWPRYILGGKASVINVQAGLSGGNEQLNFLLSGNYRKEGTVLPGNEQYIRGGFHVMIRHQSVNKKLGVEFSASYSGDNNRLLGSSVFSILTLPPNLPIYDDAGNYNWRGINDVNPDAVLRHKMKSETRNLLTNAIIRYQLLPGLELKTSIGYSYIQMEQVMIYPKNSLNPIFGLEGYANYGDNRNRLFVAEPQLEYSKKFKAGSLKILAGGTWQNNIRDGSFITGTNYSNDNLLEYTGAAGTLMATNSYSQYKYASLFTRINYQYKEKYSISLNGRRDGSSRFGPGKQFGNFGAIGAAWIFNKEKFFEKVLFLSYGKLRGSYGVTGNDLIPDYQYLSSYGISGSQYQGVVGLNPIRIANSNFGWESNKKTELALELGFMKNLLLLTAVYYQNKSGNQLIEYPLPYTSGTFGNYVANLPALIENKGWEFELDAYIIKRANFNWRINGNISLPKNKLLNYPGLESSGYANTYVIGEDLNIKKALHFNGINKQTGLPEYEDVNKDGFISLPEDYVTAGKTSAYYFGGGGSEWKYKQFSLSVFFQFTKHFAQGTATIPGTRSNKFKIALSRWRQAGDNSSIAKATTLPSGEYFNLVQSDAAFYNASFVRLKNISFSYQVPQKLRDRLKLPGFRIYAEAQNLYTWRKEGNLYDPETAISGIAPLKTIVAGIEITF